MKLATFEYGGTEAWGFVLNHPKENRLWIYEPAKVESQLQNSATPTNGFAVSMPRFMPDSGWPETLPDFLALEERGMAALEKLVRFTRTFLDQSDEARMEYCGHPLDGVQLLSPIPRPRLMWGLVQNCPTFIKFNPGATPPTCFRRVINGRRALFWATGSILCSRRIPARSRTMWNWAWSSENRAAIFPLTGPWTTSPDIPS